MAKQSFDIGGTGIGIAEPSTAGQQVLANWRQGWAPQAWERTRQEWMEKDPSFDPWGSLGGYEEFADRLLEADSQAQSDAIKAQIDANRRDQMIEARGPMNGLVTGLITGVADPLNLIPIPAVKGIGLIKGALTFGAANTALGAVAEAGRQWGSPTAEASEAIPNITLSGLIGLGLGAPVGAWGSRGRAAAMSRFEAGLGVIEDPGASIAVRGYDLGGVTIKDERPRPNPDGTQPRFTWTEEHSGYAIQELDGVRYGYDDGFGWVRANELGRPVPTPVDPAIAARLDMPTPETRTILRRHDVDIRREYADAAWHDEMQSYIDDPDVNVETVIKSENDLINFRTREYLWQRQDPRRATETQAEWRLRVGKQAMAEHRGSQVKGGYAGPQGIAFILEHMNFSPLAHAVRIFKGDNVLADTFTRIVGDYGWAQKSAEFGHAAPPSALLNGLHHSVRFFEFQSIFDQEFLKLVSNSQTAQGLSFQRANLSAAAYAMKQGIRHKMGQHVLTKDIFNEMVSLAVINGDQPFTHKGFPVNDNVRTVATALSKLLDEYEEMQRAVGLFKDQRTATRDVAQWSKEVTRLKHKANVWMFGQTGQPSAYNATITVALPASARAPAPAPGAAPPTPPGAATALKFVTPGGPLANPNYPVFVANGRIVTMVEINGTPVPFYISTGSGGKASVATGKWYPFFGWGPEDSWFNKGSETDILDFYGVPELRAAAEALDQKFGDLRPQQANTLLGSYFATAPDWMKSQSVDITGMFDHLPNVERKDPGGSAKIGAFIKSLATPAAPARAATPIAPNMLFVGTDHNDAVQAMIDALGDVGFDLAETLAPANYGYVDSALSNPTIADFIDVDTMNAQRVASLSPKQRSVYEQIKTSLDLAEANLAAAETQLASATDAPHQFTNAAGRRENYFTRYWNSSKLADERDKALYLITKWYEHDGNPMGAAARAEETVDKMILGEAGGAANIGHPGHLNSRALNIPNSFSVQHPTLGEIKATDFIDLNALAVTEHYIRVAGTRIELTKMFGDVDLKAERVRLREYMTENYLLAQTDDAGRADIVLKMQEVDDYLDLHLQAVLGTLRDSSPWRMDNRIANTGLQLTSLALMGKVVLTTTSDMMHSAMAAGFGTYFRAIFTRMFDDLETIAPGATKLNNLHGELLDTARTRYTMMAHQMENGKPVVGGTWLENFIARRMPGYFKINGLTPVTMWLKEIMGLASQHNVMTDAIRIGAKIAAGQVPNKSDQFRLNALGINARDAALLASMPYETRPNGLILPAIDNWTGPNARRARAAILTAIHAEIRRGVVTPSIGDRSTVFNGVLQHKGKKIAETDMMRIPLQFMGYGIAAHNKVLTSAIQGRDRDRVMGIFFMMLAGITATYLRTDSQQWRRKTYDQILYEGWEASGIGGFWFGDLNRQIEKVTNNRIGLRPTLGIKPGFKYDSDLQAIIAGMGAMPSIANDLRRAFMDTSIGTSRRASMLRRAVPYNNVLWWDRLGKDFTGEAVDLIGGRGGRE